MKDFCDVAPDRMFGAGMVAPHDVAGAVVEARRCVEELGFKAIFLAPATVNRRPWHHPAYDPLWAEVERLDVPISFHGGGQTYLTPDFSLEVLDKLMLWHTFSQPLGIQFVDRVLLRRRASSSASPTCALALLEGNCSWAPWLLYRLDEHYEWTGRYEAPELTMPPSEYFRRNCWISLESRRGDRSRTSSARSETTAGVLDRLPARRLEVPARGRRVRQAADVRREQGRAS